MQLMASVVLFLSFLRNFVVTNFIKHPINSI